MEAFQYNILKVYVLYREMKDAGSASPLFVGVGANPFISFGFRHIGQLPRPRNVSSVEKT